MLLTLPLLRPDERFCFMGVDLARVTDEAHGLLGQRAVATAELPSNAATAATVALVEVRELIGVNEVHEVA